MAAAVACEVEAAEATEGTGEGAFKGAAAAAGLPAAMSFLSRGLFPLSADMEREEASVASPVTKATGVTPPPSTAPGNEGAGADRDGETEGDDSDAGDDADAAAAEEGAATSVGATAEVNADVICPAADADESSVLTETLGCC